MLVLSIAPENFDDYLKAVHYAKKYSADAIEIRCEKLSKKLYRSILNDSFQPKIVTFRTTDYTIKNFIRLLDYYKIAFENNVSIIDVDYSWGKENIKKIFSLRGKTKVILSYHNYFRTPSLSNLKNLLNKMNRFKPDFLKIAVYAEKVEDNSIIFHLLEYAKTEKIKLSAHCMGEFGKASRIVGKKFGSQFIYSSLEDERNTAAGQISLSKLVNHFNYHKINSKTKIFGIVGNPLAQSKSWLFHNYGYKLKNINAVYLNFLIDDLKFFLKSFKKYISGLSVTIPYKERIITFTKSQSSKVKKIGATNTVKISNGIMELFNTDYLGFRKLILKDKSLQKSRILIVGAGGTARAIIFALKEFNNEIFLTNRNPSRAKKLAEDFDIFFLDSVIKKALNFDVIINTTPKDNEFLLSTAKKIFNFRNVKLAVDVVMYPIETKFILLAKKKGVKVITGFDFFIEQAHLQFEIFTGSKLPRKQIERYLHEYYNHSF